MAFGFIIAAGAAAVFLPVAAFFDPSVRDVALHAIKYGVVEALLHPFGVRRDIAADVSALASLFWAVEIGVCAAPLAVVALIGEIAAARGFVLHAAGCGFLAAASPWILRATRGSLDTNPANPAELRVAALFFLTGVLTGSIYWAIAVRGVAAEERALTRRARDGEPLRLPGRE